MRLHLDRAKRPSQFNFDKTIKAGDILTSFTVLISVIALLLTLSKDRDTRIAEQANKVRAAAASAIVKLDRWQAVELSLYQALQPTFVELSEELAMKFDVVSVRDKFWKAVNAERTRIARQVMDEQLGTAYAELLTHFPAARVEYVNASTRIAEIESETTEAFLAACEQRILRILNKQKEYQTPDLGNAFREEAARYSSELRLKSDVALHAVRSYLHAVIAMSDERITAVSRDVPTVADATAAR